MMKRLKRYLDKKSLTLNTDKSKIVFGIWKGKEQNKETKMEVEEKGVGDS